MYASCLAENDATQLNVSTTKSTTAPFGGRSLLGDVLPAPLLLNVYQFLNVADWGRGERVSKDFRAILTNPVSRVHLFEHYDWDVL